MYSQPILNFYISSFSLYSSDSLYKFYTFSALQLSKRAFLRYSAFLFSQTSRIFYFKVKPAVGSIFGAYYIFNGLQSSYDQLYEEELELYCLLAYLQPSCCYSYFLFLSLDLLRYLLNYFSLFSFISAIFFSIYFWILMGRRGILKPPWLSWDQSKSLMAYSPMVMTESSLLSLKEWLMQAQTIQGSTQTLKQISIKQRTFTLLAFSMMLICYLVGCSSANRQKYEINYVGMSFEFGVYASIEIYSGVILCDRSFMFVIAFSFDLQKCDSSMFFCNFQLKCDLKKLVFHLMIQGKFYYSFQSASLFCCYVSAFFSISWHFLHFLDIFGCMGHPLTTSTCGILPSTDSAMELYFCSLVIPDSKRTVSPILACLQSCTFLSQCLI